MRPAVLLDPATAAGDELAAELVVVHHPIERVGQAVDVGGVDEHGGVTERLGQRAARAATTGTPAPIASRGESPKPS